MGIRSLVQRRPSLFVGTQLLALRTLMSHKIQTPDGDGGRKVVTIQGCAHALYGFDRIYGSASFDYNCETPWQHLLSNVDSGHSIRRGIEASRDAFVRTLLDTPAPLESPLFAVESLGANLAGKGIAPDSPTRLLSMACEDFLRTEATDAFRNLASRDITKIAFENGDRFSSQFLTTPPDAIGHLDDIQFVVAVATYLGVPCPIFKHYADAGMFISNGRTDRKIDPSGFAVACMTGMPRNDFTPIHDAVKWQLARFARFAGLPVHVESNLFADLPPALAVRTETRTNNRGGSLVQPDILVDQFPASKKARTNVTYGVAPPTARVAFEIKGRHLGVGEYSSAAYFRSSRSGRSAGREVDKAVPTIRREYDTRCNKLDAAFAQCPPLGIGPYTACLRGLYKGGVFPVVFGTFGEFSADFDDILHTLARLAAKRQREAGNCPPCSTLVERTNFFLASFRRTMGTLVTRAHANLKLCRRCYIGRTPAEARHKTHRQRFPSSGGRMLPNWFHVDSRDSAVYATFDAQVARSGVG